MDELKNKIIDFFKKTNKKYTKDDLKKQFNINGEEQTNFFNCAIDELIIEGSLFFNDKKQYQLLTNSLGFAYGEIEINKSGNGFVHTKDGYTIFIERSDLNGALNKDKVLVSSIIPGRKNDFKGEIFKILKRNNNKVVFDVIGNSYNCTLINHNNENININVNKNELKNLIDGDIVLVELNNENINGYFNATIEKIIGHKNDPNMDVKLLALEYNIPLEFSKESLDEANNIPSEVTEDDIKNRVDLRNLDIITIDCDDTKDRDDAVYVEKMDNGNYKLYTSISSVNHYVKKGTSLYNEALERCTSHYPANFCIPMFPKSISNSICSLNQNVDRLTKTVEIEINSKGQIINTKIYNSVINSKKEMKYSEVNKILNGENVNGYESFIKQLKLLKELSDIYEEARKNRNCIDFDLPDIKIVEDNNGQPIDFVKSGIGNSERIIENLMLLTNNAVANYYSWFPLIYRIHEIPSENKIKEIIDLLRISGFDIPKTQNINENTIINIIDKVKDTESANIVKTILLKSMKKAKYSIKNPGHFALQLDNYCHFTSPIRRISDFMIHTIIDEIDTFEFNEKNINELERELNVISENASSAEKNDKLLEDSARAMYMAEYMEKHIGEGFDAIVTEVYPNGMFVQTNNFISGKIKFEDMGEDGLFYDNDKKAILSRKNNTTYRIGNKIYVIVKNANKINRTVDFKIEKNKQKSLRKS